MHKRTAGLIFMSVMSGLLATNSGNASSNADPLLAEIAALKTNLTILTTKVNTLSTQVTKLQNGTVTVSDLPGTYTLISTAFEQTVISGGDEGGFQDAYNTSLTTVTLNSDFTLSASSSNYTYNFGVNIATCCEAGQAAVADPLNTSVNGNTGTWSYANGILTIIITGGPTFTLTSTNGGRMFVAVLTDNSGAPQATTIVRND